MDDLDRLDEGFVQDMIIEYANDDVDYPYLATQADFDRF
jgi:hypothetical protein